MVQSSDLTPYNEQVLPPAPGGMGGGGGGGGFGGGGFGGGGFGGAVGRPGMVLGDGSVSVVDHDSNVLSAVVPSAEPQAGAPVSGADPFAAPQDSAGGVAAIVPQTAQPAKPSRGNARLSVNVNLDVPSDYQAREFVSVADAVHQPSVLSLVVQRRGQIGAIRLVAALIVILLAWRMRNAPLLWKLTVATTLFLAAIGLLPLLSNAWQSLLDGVALGALVSVGMALGCLCCSWCTCGLTKLKRSTMFGNLKVAQSNVSK